MSLKSNTSSLRITESCNKAHSIIQSTEKTGQIVRFPATHRPASISLVSVRHSITDEKLKTTLKRSSVGRSSGCRARRSSDDEFWSRLFGQDREIDEQGTKEMDSDCQKMIVVVPDTFLADYAWFFNNKMKGDTEMCQQYCKGALNAHSENGMVLSLRGKLIWEIYRDANLAESYYIQAVESSPNDCMVLASYAAFLWEVEDDED